MKKTIPTIKNLHSPINFYGKTFIVHTLCKADLEDYFTVKQLGKLTDDDMSQMAGDISEAIMNCGYWDIVKGVCDYFKKSK